MSENISTHGQEEILALLEELGEIKEVLREASRQLLRIERRVKAAVPGLAAKSPRRTKQHLDERAAQQVIDSLKQRVANGEQVEASLRDYSVKPELQALARVLGITNTKLPPKDELVRRISTRLRQSVSVASGIHTDAESGKAK